jgi:hypothetical protein
MRRFLASAPRRTPISPAVSIPRSTAVRPTGVLSCVVDSDPRFSLEVLRWYATATRLAGVPGPALTVNLVGHDASDVASYLRSRQVIVRSIAPFDPRSPHCNKIAGALRLLSELPPGPCVLTDTDVALFADPRTILISADSVGMTPVDLPNPPVKVLRKIFATAGVPEPAVVATPWRRRARTLVGNGNGGLYVVPAPLLTSVATAWARWARWLLDRSHLLGGWFIHVDQVAMALALSAEQINVVDVGRRWNVPTHLGKLPADVPSPAMVHYHRAIDGLGAIAMTQRAPVDRLIARANIVTAEILGEQSRRPDAE